MTKISETQVKKLAQLVRISIDDNLTKKLVGELGSILDYFDRLQEVDIAGLKPTTQVTGLKNVTRPDEIIDYGVSKAELLKNVPSTEAGYIKVKRVL